MKLGNLQALTILALALTGGLARGQSHVPGPDDYAAFSRFIAERNIFNPDRYPHGSTYQPQYYPSPVRRSSPAFSFVGTMIYNKGMFAFFDGNNNDYRKSLQTSGKIAGYTVQNITLTNVTLMADGKTLELKVGAVMRKSRDGTWVESNESEDFSTSTDNSSAGSSPASTAAPDASAAAPANSGNVSDVLKRLMMLRQQENK